MTDKLSRGIKQRTKDVGKSYTFNEEHNPHEPLMHWWQDAQEGLTLFTVFYSMTCRWSRCTGCNLPGEMSCEHVPFDDIMQQIDHLFLLPDVAEKASKVRKFIVSNNGSVLDQDTFSSTALMYLLAKCNMLFPQLSTFALETRPEYIEWEELEFLSRALKEGKTPSILEIAIGFEAFDSTIRNDVFQKGLELPVFEKMAEKLAAYGFSLKCYFMLKPVPEMSDEEAITDICSGIDYLDSIAVKHGLTINMHLNPTYVAKGTSLVEAFNAGTFTPPTLLDVAKAAAHAEGKQISIYVGLSDEGLAIPGGSFLREGDTEIIKALEHLNRTQDFSKLAAFIKE